MGGLGTAVVLVLGQFYTRVAVRGNGRQTTYPQRDLSDTGLVVPLYVGSRWQALRHTGCVRVAPDSRRRDGVADSGGVGVIHAARMPACSALPAD